MSHLIHHTRAIVLGCSPRGEHDAAITFFSEQFGRVTARALGIRKESSKLRYSLQPLTHAHIALVRGRDIWRVTGANVIDQPYQRLSDAPEVRTCLVRVLGTVRRLVVGESSHPELYQCLETVCIESENIPPTPEAVAAFEYISLVRICTLLGYGPSDDERIARYALQSPISRELLTEAFIDRPLLVRHINAALHTSQL